MEPLKLGDYVIAGAVLLLAAGIWAALLFGSGPALYAEITQEDTLLARVPLGTAQTLTVDGAVHNEIAVEGGAVRFAHSDCPDQVCVRTGALSRAGQVAVCLPNRVIVRVTGGESEIDAVVGGVGG